MKHISMAMAVQMAANKCGPVYMLVPAEVTEETTVAQLREAFGFVVDEEWKIQDPAQEAVEEEPETATDEPKEEPEEVSEKKEPAEPEEPAYPKQKKSCLRAKTPQDKIDKIIELHQQGCTQKDICMKVGVSQFVVSNEIKKYKEKLGSKRKPLDRVYDSEFEKDVLHLYECGNTPDAIAMALKCELVAVTTYLKRNGINC